MGGIIKGKQMSHAWVPSKAEETGNEIESATTATQTVSVGITDGDVRIEDGPVD